VLWYETSFSLDQFGFVPTVPALLGDTFTLLRNAYIVQPPIYFYQFFLLHLLIAQAFYIPYLQFFFNFVQWLSRNKKKKKFFFIFFF